MASGRPCRWACCRRGTWGRGRCGVWGRGGARRGSRASVRREGTWRRACGTGRRCSCVVASLTSDASQPWAHPIPLTTCKAASAWGAPRGAAAGRRVVVDVWVGAVFRAETCGVTVELGRRGQRIRRRGSEGGAGRPSRGVAADARRLRCGRPAQPDRRSRQRPRGRRPAGEAVRGV